VTARRSIFALLLRFLAVLGLCALMTWRAQAGEAPAVSLEARLILASNNPKPPPSARRLDLASVSRFFHVYKWTNFFLINKERFSVGLGTTRRVSMTSGCVAVVKNLGGGRLACQLYRGGKLSGSQTATLAPDGRIIFGGDAGERNAWFVSLRYPREETAGLPVPSRAFPAQAAPSLALARVTFRTR
jgi:hypothetical protein